MDKIEKVFLSKKRVDLLYWAELLGELKWIYLDNEYIRLQDVLGKQAQDDHWKVLESVSATACTILILAEVYHFTGDESIPSLLKQADDYGFPDIISAKANFFLRIEDN